MFRRNLLFILPVLLALALAGCLPGSATSPSPTTPHATQAVPPTTPAPQPSPTPEQPATAEPTTAEPSPTLPVEASPTGAPTSAPSGNAIAHLPAGQEIALTYINMLDKNLGWGIGGLNGAGDHILTTKDGGNTWMDVTPPEPAGEAGAQKLALGDFPDANTAWVTYSYSGTEPKLPAEPLVWRTQDGGQTWQSSSPLDVSGINETYQPSHLVFADQNAGWLLVHVGVGMNHDYVFLYKTVDGGQNWSRVLDPYNDGGIQSCVKTGMVFPVPENGWLTGDCNGVAPGVLLFHSTDGGASWQSVNLPPPSETPNLFTDQMNACGTYSPQFLDDKNGKMVVQCSNYNQNPPTMIYYLYSTSDSGFTWSAAPYPGGTLLMIDANTGWALSQDINQTQDSGAHWNKLGSVTWQGQFDFVDAQTGWAVARQGDQLALVNTTNGGAIWEELKPKIGQ